MSMWRDVSRMTKTGKTLGQMQAQRFSKIIVI